MIFNFRDRADLNDIRTRTQVMKLHELKQQLSLPKKIVLTSHRNPDGDAIGSMLGLFQVLIDLGHDVRLIVPSDYPEAFNWLAGCRKMIVHDRREAEANSRVEQADIIFSLDYNALDRVDNLGASIRKNKSAIKVLIDHHLYPEPFADYELSDTTASSTCELIVDFLDSLEWADKLTAAGATCLYTGILTDTGSFKYATSPKLFRTVARLLEAGANDYDIQNRIFNNNSLARLKASAYCIHETLVVLPEFATAYATLDQDDYKRLNIRRGDTDGIVNRILSLKGIVFAALITEQKDIVKLSLRSLGDFSAQQVATEHFNGGGHKNASGGRSNVSLKETVKKFESILPQYEHELGGFIEPELNTK